MLNQDSRSQGAKSMVLDLLAKRDEERSFGFPPRISRGTRQTNCLKDSFLHFCDPKSVQLDSKSEVTALISNAVSDLSLISKMIDDR